MRVIEQRLTLWAVLALVGAACGGGGSPAATEAAAVDESTATTTGEETEGEESLAEFFGWPTGDDPEAAQAQFEEQEARIQELVRACMVEQGFEYIPAVQPTGAAMAIDASSEEEWAAEQGFGITTWYGNEDFGQPMEESGWVDPNQEIVEAMSESEREAYYEALYGPPDQGEPQVDEETGETIYTMEGFGAGCMGQAQEEVYGNQNALWEEMQPELDEMWQRMQADPRIVEANEAWAACMADQGFQYATQQEMYESGLQDFQKRFEEIVGPNGGWADPFEGWSQEEIEAFVAEKTPEELEAFYAQAQEEVEAGIDQAALAALQQEERDLAVANYQCSLDMRDLWEDLSKEYEAAFIREHRDQLEEIRREQEGTGG